MREWIPDWWRRRQAAARLVRDDADALIEQWGEDSAYYEARQRGRQARSGEIVDPDRPQKHWFRVTIEIARRSKTGVGLDVATRYLHLKD